MAAVVVALVALVVVVVVVVVTLSRRRATGGITVMRSSWRTSSARAWGRSVAKRLGSRGCRLHIDSRSSLLW